MTENQKAIVDCLIMGGVAFAVTIVLIFIGVIG